MSLRLARRDLRGGLAAFRGVWLALLLSAALLAGIATLTQGLGASLRAVAEDSIGGDLSYRLFHRPASPQERAVLEAAAADGGQLSHAAELRAPVRAADGRATLAEVKAVDDAYPLYGTLRLSPDRPLAEVLAGSDGRAGAVAAPELLARLGLAVGDELRLGATILTVAGTVEAEPDAALRAFALGPRLLLSHAALADSGLAAPGAPVHHYYRLRLPDAATAASARARIAAALPDANWRTVAAADGVPGAERVLEIAALLVTLAGLAAVLIAAAATAAAVRAHLHDRRRSVAILRALGAESGLLGGLLTGQVGLALLAGAVPGALLGAVLAWLGLPALTGWLDLDAFRPSPAVPLRGALLAVAATLLSALLFAALPLGRAARRPPAAPLRGLADAVPPAAGPLAWAVAGLAAVALVALVAATTPLPLLAAALVALAALLVGLFLLLGAAVRRLLGLGARHLRGSARLAASGLAARAAPTRTVLACLGLSLALLLLLALVADAARQHLRTALPASAPDLVLLHLPPEQETALRDWLADAAPTARLTLLPFLHGRLVGLNGRAIDERDVPAAIRWAARGDRGLSWLATPPDPDRIVAGAWWPADHAGPPQAALDAEVARRLGLGLGDRIAVAVLDRRVEAEIAVLRALDWTRLDLDVPLILSPDALADLPHGLLGGLWLAEGEADAVRAALAERFPDLPAIAVGPALDRLADLVAALIAVAQAVAALLALIALAVLAAGLAAGRRERLREAAVLRALGARRADLLRLGLIESALLALLALALAVPAGTLAAALVIGGVIGAEWRPAALPILAVAGAGVLVALVAGLAGLGRLLRASPASLLREA